MASLNENKATHVALPQVELRNVSAAWGLGAAMLLVGGMLTWLSIARYLGYNAAMLDLGNMAQAIASVRRGEPLLFTYQEGATSRLALHVELFYFLIAPFYAIWPDPRLLLVIQALLFALGALPVYRMALRRSASGFVAFSLALCYLFYPVAQTAVLFDFHGDTLAMPLLLFMLDALDRRAWRSYALFLVLALSCKFYVAIPVAVLGLVIWWCYGERRAGLLTMATGVMYGALAFLVIRPLFTTEQTSDAHQGLNYISFYFGRLHELQASWDTRLFSAIVVFAPGLLLWRGWPWLLPALPVAAAVLISTGPASSYDFRYHHYGLVVPFIVMAMVMHNRQQHPPDDAPRVPLLVRHFSVIVTLLLVLAFNITLVDTPLNSSFWSEAPGRGLDSAKYGIIPRDQVKDRFLAEVVPPNAAIAASTMLAPHLSDRAILYTVRHPNDIDGQGLPKILPRVEYVLTDALFDYRLPVTGGFAGGSTYERDEIALLLRDPAFGLVAARDGLLLFRRNVQGDAALVQQIEVAPASDAPAQARFGPISLLDAQIVAQGGRRFLATFTWRSDEPLNAVAISQLAGSSGARLVHLPSYALLPTRQWQPGQLVRETFAVEFPADLPAGRYTWQLGWYNLGHSESFATDERSRLAGSQLVAIGEVELP